MDNELKAIISNELESRWVTAKDDLEVVENSITSSRTEHYEIRGVFLNGITEMTATQVDIISDEEKTILIEALTSIKDLRQAYVESTEAAALLFSETGELPGTEETSEEETSEEETLETGEL